MARPVIVTLFLLFFLAAAFSSLPPRSALAADSGDCSQTEKTVISGLVTAADDGPVAGVILIEKGRLYGKDFRYGGLIDREGRFSVKVDQGGDYGIHIYATGYIYFPLGINALSGQNNYDTYRLPPNPAVSHAPVIDNVRFEGSEDSSTIAISVSDPDGDLSHQVLALNRATGRAFRMKPPSFVFPWTKNYPDGVYTLGLKSAGAAAYRVINPRDWFFVAADNRCYNSPVMKYPFDAESFIEAHGVTALPPGPGETGGVTGQGVFRDNCRVCHYPDSTRTKVGPGLKGLFNLKTSPVRGFQMNEANVITQIKHGGTVMPPYAHLTDSELRALIEYLKTL